MFRHLTAAALVAMAATNVQAANWKVVYEESRLGFTVTQTGSEISGHFREFDADITFHPDNLDASHFEVTVDVTSIDTGSAKRDSVLGNKVWFWFDKYPRARFVTNKIVHKDGKEYLALGDLTIKSITHEIKLHFSWKRRGNQAKLEGHATAVMEGGLTMDRTRWNVGTGKWAEGDTIGRRVEVEFHLLLQHVGDK